MDPQTTKRFRMFLSFEKEEAWLEEMSARGLHLIKAPGLFYTFAKGQPKQRIYKMDFRIALKKAEREEYLNLFADSGWTYIPAGMSSTSFYFFSPADESGKDIFSDGVSKAQQHLRYAQAMLYTFLIAFLPYLSLYLSGSIRVQDVGYKTPGLWSMSGANFIGHFLFETPFVVLRLLGYFFPLLMLLLGLFFLLNSVRSYRKQLNQD